MKSFTEMLHELSAQISVIFNPMSAQGAQGVLTPTPSEDVDDDLKQSK